MTSLPLGEVFFQHDLLRCNGFDPSNPSHFYSHVLLQVVYNASVDEFYSTADAQNGLPIKDHRRAGKLPRHWTSGTSTDYIAYKYISAMTGPSCTAVQGTDQLRTDIGRSELEREGNATRVAYIPVKMPSLNERFLWVDLTFPLRAILLPLQHQAHPKATNYCRYYQYDLRRLEVRLSGLTRVAPERAKPTGPEAPHAGDLIDEPDLPDEYLQKLQATGRVPATFKRTEVVWKPNEAHGWADARWTARFNIPLLYYTGLIPTEHLKDEFQNWERAVCLFGYAAVEPTNYTHDATPGIEEKIWAGSEVCKRNMGSSAEVIDLAQLLSRAHATSFQYGKEAGAWPSASKLINDVAVLGVGMIPIVGPLAAWGWTVLYEAVTDPEHFVEKKFGKENTGELLATLVSTGKNVAPVLRHGTSSFTPSTVLHSAGKVVQGLLNTVEGKSGSNESEDYPAVTLPPLSMEVVQYGGNGGNPFYAYPPNASTLKTLEVWTGPIDSGSGEILKAIRFTWFGWEDRRDQKRESLGLFGQTQKGTAPYKKSSFTFEEGEMVNWLVIRAAGRVDRIMFETNHGRWFSAGGMGGEVYRLGAGYITGAQGRAAGELDKLGFGLSETDPYRG